MMKLRNPFRHLSKPELFLWGCSLVVVTLAFLLSGGDWLTLLASLIGVTALIFLAKGDVTGQFLTVLFCLLYGIISYRFRYYGEMITYLGMTMPIALSSVYTWLRHPHGDTHEVAVGRLGQKKLAVLVLLTLLVTFCFYWILRAFDTPNLWLSTLSVATSFLAASLLLLRSPYYAIAYSGNDIVLIVLWILASLEALSYLPMVLCFVMFLVNDGYGFISWRKMERRQRQENSPMPDTHSDPKKS